jgi:hypothetical protein
MSHIPRDASYGTPTHPAFRLPLSHVPLRYAMSHFPRDESLGQCRTFEPVLFFSSSPSQLGFPLSPVSHLDAKCPTFRRTHNLGNVALLNRFISLALASTRLAFRSLFIPLSPFKPLSHFVIQCPTFCGTHRLGNVALLTSFCFSPSSLPRDVPFSVGCT